MKTNCIKYNDCRKPVQTCNGKCKGYEREGVVKNNCKHWRINNQGTGFCVFNGYPITAHVKCDLEKQKICKWYDDKKGDS